MSQLLTVITIALCRWVSDLLSEWIEISVCKGGVARTESAKVLRSYCPVSTPYSGTWIWEERARVRAC